MSDIQLAGSPGNLYAQKIQINTAGNSEMFSLQGKALVGIFMPAAWTAAALGYKVGWNGNAGDLAVLKYAGTPVTTIVGAGDFVTFPLPNAVFGPFMQINSVTVDTSELVVQGAARDLILLLRDLFS